MTKRRVKSVNLPSLARKANKAAALPLGILAGRGTGDVVILLYHRVGVGEREIDVAADAFEHQMATLATTGEAISLDRALSGQGGVVITVDDGFRDFHQHVLPTLVRHRIPATLYLTTSYVGDPSLDGEALSWRHLEEAAGTGLVTVGAHTHSHADLSGADEKTAEDEMRRSQEIIEDRLGAACRHFAFPWAVASQASLAASRRRFDSSALHAWRVNRREGLDPHALGRTPVLRSDGRFFFGRKVAGRLDGEAHLYRLARRGPWGRG
jgi:peptidoglycan/xylan/chitin deacetylase (PgdA/CDA1 family)